MTKKEAAEMEALRRDLRIARAMRFTEPVRPDVPCPQGVSGRVLGWHSHAYQGVTACKGWAESGRHGDGWDEPRGSASQGGRWLYSTRLLALRAGRHELEMQFARTLAEVDADIEKELVLETNSVTPAEVEATRRSNE